MGVVELAVWQFELFAMMLNLNGVARFKQCFCIIQAYYKHLDMFFGRRCRKFETSFWKAAIISVTWVNKTFRVSLTVVV